MKYLVQTKDGPRAKWRPVQRLGRMSLRTSQWSTREFASIDDAVKFCQSLDQDGAFNTDARDIRIVTDLGERVEFDKKVLYAEDRT